MGVGDVPARDVQIALFFMVFYMSLPLVKFS